MPFHEVETLPDNDRVRYTISPAARREVVKRLLAVNGGAKRDHLGGVRRDRLAAAGLSP